MDLLEAHEVLVRDLLVADLLEAVPSLGLLEFHLGGDLLRVLLRLLAGDATSGRFVRDGLLPPHRRNFGRLVLERIETDFWN